MLKTIEVAMPTHVQPNPSLSPSPCLPISTRNLRNKKRKTKTAYTYKTWKITAVSACTTSSSSSSSSGPFNQTVGGQFLSGCEISRSGEERSRRKKRVFFLDVNPLCYAGSTPSLHSFGYWISLFFSQVSLSDPVIAVLDGEGGHEHRRKLLPSYKAHRRKFLSQSSAFQKFSKGQSSAFKRSSKGHVTRSEVVMDVLTKCNVPVVKIEGHEADDVVATLVEQVLQRGYKAVVASPDKDFKQLVSEDVQIVLPVTELKRWSFYTIKHYIAQYNCDPCSDLSLRCIMGDEVDGIPGIQSVAPGFGRKTALKLLKKHGSLENLLNVAAIRTVGKPYAQDALTKHADYLRRNYEVLALRRCWKKRKYTITKIDLIFQMVKPPTALAVPRQRREFSHAKRCFSTLDQYSMGIKLLR
ncbi:DNA polymerase I, putative [Ricinus communis]|uniref:DNA polymerase I, putative n=1 Tax=Ricinus communis TaxID=3988 RepID=B9SLH3_RICCO|nr:DNA polymerase I, putative [Ricinus communis]